MTFYIYFETRHRKENNSSPTRLANMCIDIAIDRADMDRLTGAKLSRLLLQHQFSYPMFQIVFLED